MNPNDLWHFTTIEDYAQTVKGRPFCPETVPDLRSAIDQVKDKIQIRVGFDFIFFFPFTLLFQFSLSLSLRVTSRLIIIIFFFFKKKKILPQDLTHNHFTADIGQKQPQASDTVIDQTSLP